MTLTRMQLSRKLWTQLYVTLRTTLTKHNILRDSNKSDMLIHSFILFWQNATYNNCEWVSKGIYIAYVMSSSRKWVGRLFQTRGPATAKLLSPNVLCVLGTAHDLSVEERSRRRWLSETRCMSSARYGGATGAWPDKDEKTKHASL